MTDLTGGGELKPVSLLEGRAGNVIGYYTIQYITAYQETNLPNSVYDH